MRLVWRWRFGAIVGEKSHFLRLVERAAMRCVDLAAEHEPFTKLGNECVMRLDDRVRRLKAGREQDGVGRIVHRTIGAAACPC